MLFVLERCTVGEGVLHERILKCVLSVGMRAEIEAAHAPYGIAVSLYSPLDVCTRSHGANKSAFSRAGNRSP